MMKSRVRPLFLALTAPFIFSVLPACLSTGVRSSGSDLPQTGTRFSDGQLRVSVKHNCDKRCESFRADFENLSAAPLEILMGQGQLKRGAEAFSLKRLGKEKGNIVVPPRGTVTAELAPYSAATGRRLSYVVPRAVWCSVKMDAACKNTVEVDAHCAGYARGYFTVYKEAQGWVLLTFAYRTGDRVEMLQSPPPETTNFQGPADTPQTNDRAPAFFRDPDDVVFYKIECNDKCKCKGLTRPRTFSDDAFKPVIEPIP